MNSVAVSKSWKFRSICAPIIHPITTQNGTYKSNPGKSGSYQTKSDRQR